MPVTVPATALRVEPTLAEPEIVALAMVGVVETLESVSPEIVHESGEFVSVFLAATPEVSYVRLVASKATPDVTV